MPHPHLDFFNPYSHGFARVAVAVPRIRVADPAFNAAEMIAMLAQAAAQGAVVVAFPELGLSVFAVPYAAATGPEKADDFVSREARAGGE